MKTKQNKSCVRKFVLTPPTLKDNTADADRLIMAMKTELKADSVDIDFELLKKLPGLLRESNYNVKCVVYKDLGRLILAGVTDSRENKIIAGMAIDLGTTRVVLRLLELESGKILGESSFDNPQISIGPDILARIHFADKNEGLNVIKGLIIEELNLKIDVLCRESNILPEQIYLLAVAGNTAMTHLFLGLDPRWIIREPYIPVVNRPGIVKTKELGINVNPGARALVFPNVGSYFGGDLIAGIIYSGIAYKEDTSILVDVGTNAEVVIGNKNWLMACAGAAGPALEGGVTKMGMMAGPGVIDRVTIKPGTCKVDIHTIDEKPPVGICGSGLIDLAAQLFLSGMIDIRGRFVPSVCGDQLKEKDGIRHLIVARSKGKNCDLPEDIELTISQVDLDSLIRSKAAMYTILETITLSVGMSMQDLSTFYVAGTFGSFINPVSAISIGMLPDLPINSYKSLGNSSLGGATMALSLFDCMEEIDKIRDNITYLELNVNQEFMNRFSAAKFLPHTDPLLFTSVKVIN